MQLHCSLFFDTMDIFRFSSRSADKLPGKLAGEFVEHASWYSELESHKDWRRVLSNFHIGEFRYNGKTYRTIEHGFQAAKISLQDPTLAEQFCVESGSELGSGDGLAARKARKIVILSKSNVAIWGAISADVMDSLAQAKFTQCAAAMNILKLTGSAQLWHVAPRMKPVRFSHLERIRDQEKHFSCV